MLTTVERASDTPVFYSDAWQKRRIGIMQRVAKRYEKTLQENQMVLKVAPKGKPSRSKLNMCKNVACPNGRRHGSAFCQVCSDKYKKHG